MRTFVAVDFTDAIKSQFGALQDRLKPRCPQLKWVSPQQMHLTLKFLGEIDEQQVADIRKALDVLAGQCRPMDITVEQIGTFRPAGPVNVIWVGLHDATGHLAQCHAACEKLLAPLGFPLEDRPFSPHLTLARNNSPANSPQIRTALAAEPPFCAGTQSVAGVTFYHSTLTPRGPIYEVLSSHAFTA